MTTFARKEGEWLDQQEKRVAEQEAQTKSDSMEYLQQHEDVVIATLLGLPDTFIRGPARSTPDCAFVGYVCTIATTMKQKSFCEHLP